MKRIIACILTSFLLFSACTPTQMTKQTSNETRPESGTNKANSSIASTKETLKTGNELPEFTRLDDPSLRKSTPKLGA